MAIDSAFRRDENFVPITTLGLQESKTITYVAGTTGATGTTTLFTVTGKVAINVYALCTSDLAGSGTIEVGVAGSTAALCNQQSATAIDNHEVWSDSSLAIAANVASHLHVVDQDVIQTIASNTVTAGTLIFYCNWVPLSEDGNVVAA